MSGHHQQRTRSSLRNVLDQLHGRQRRGRRRMDSSVEALEPRQLLSVTVTKVSDGVENDDGTGTLAAVEVKVTPSDPNGAFDSAGYNWVDFDDGSGSEFTLTDQTIYHMYKDPGDYSVTVTDTEWSNGSLVQFYGGPAAVSVDDALVTKTPKPASTVCDGVDPDPAVNVPLPALPAPGVDALFKHLEQFQVVGSTEQDIPNDPDGDSYYGWVWNPNDKIPPNFIPSIPQLVEAVNKQSGHMMLGVQQGQNVDWFETNSGSQDGSGMRGAVTPGSTFQEKFDTGTTMTYPSGSHTVTVVERSGLALQFNDFTHGKASGELVGISGLSGDTLTPTYDSTSGSLTGYKVTATQATVTAEQQIEITYVDDEITDVKFESRTFDSSQGQNENNTDWTVVQQEAYTYYGSSDPNGESGQIQTVTVEDGSNNPLQTYLYRYWVNPDDANSSLPPDGMLKSYVGADAYARAAAALPAGTTMLTASDTQLEPFVDRYFDYDHAGNPTDMIAQGAGCSACVGGQGTFTYSFDTNASANPADLNSWALKATITRPDGTVDYQYYDSNGFLMLDAVDNGTGQLSGTFTEYDSAGHSILVAQPSAVDLSAGLTTLQSYGDLLHKVSGSYQYLNSSSGQIETMSYYSSTTATASSAGGAVGYLSDSYLQNGQSGTPVHQENLTYYGLSDSAGDVTVYPVAADTVYGDAAGTDPRTTSYQYTTYAGTVAIASQQTTYPDISSGQNGPGTADVEYTYYDAFGNPIWTKDADGHVNYTAYDLGTGAVVETITDVNYASLTSTEQTSFGQTGWVHPSGGLSLVTTYAVDLLGRTTEEMDPNANAASSGVATYTIYNDVTHDVRVYPGFNPATVTTTGPIQVTREYYPTDNSGDFHYTETLTSSATPHLTGGVPDGTETIDADNIQSLQRDFTNGAGQVLWSDRYVSLAGVTYSQSVTADANGNPIDLGTAGTNYYRTTYGYDHLGRQNKVVSSTGTITRVVYDALGRVSSTWVGTNDTPASGYWSPTNNTSPSNMVDIEDDVYDNGGVGDGDLTETVQHPGGGAADRVTLNLYDWRDRLIASKAGALLDSSGNPYPAGETDGAHRLIAVTNYDNLDEAVATATYAGDGVSLGDFATWMPSADASKLRAYSTQSFDNQGRVYLGLTYSVDPATGTIGSSLATNFFFDHRGNTIEESAPGGLVTKHQFDGAGRDVKDSTTDGGAVNSAAATWANAGTTTNDVVLEQVLNTYDPDSNLTESIDRQRFDSDPTDAASGGAGDLAGPSGGNLASRDYYTANYYDAADRLIDAVNVGTNGGVVWARPATVPAGADTVLVNHTDYNPAGYVADTIDPRGIMAGTFYDLLGRQVETIAAWDGTSNPTPTSSTNQITEYTFNGDDNVLTMTAVMPSGVPSQTTAYLYGTTSTSGVFSNTLLSKIEYPDLTTGAASAAAANVEAFTYNALGQKATYSDRNGTTHYYGFDVLGRLTSDTIPWWLMGAGVSTQTTGLAYTFNDAGLPFQQTSLTSYDQSSTENQVEDIYNGYGQLTQQYQESNGAVNTATSSYVAYGYTQVGNASRLTSLTYPNGRQEDYLYASGIDDAISRISAIADHAGSGMGTVAAYTYLGQGTIVQESEPQIDTELTYIQQSGDSNAITDGGDRYTGLDRFGRVDDQYYLNTSTGATLDRIQYGYDRDGNTLYANNLVNGTFSELYHTNSTTSGDSNAAYDSLSRITSFSRGTLTSSGNNGSELDTITSANLNSTSGVPNQNSWNLDALGNWNSGAGVSNTFNAQNEETANGSNALAYDHAGNMTNDEVGNVYIFDAWNHVVQINSGSGSLLEVFKYDALGRNDVVNNGAGWESVTYDLAGRELQTAYGSTYTQNVWGLTYVFDLILRDRNQDGTSTGNLGFTGSGLEEREYAQHDSQFSIISITDASGSVIQRIIYDAYGKTTLLTANWAVDLSSGGTNYWTVYFQGMTLVTDGTTGNMLRSQSRIYNVDLGRWTSQDPTRYADGSNLYEFIADQPTSNLDPTGLSKKHHPHNNDVFSLPSLSDWTSFLMDDVAEMFYGDSNSWAYQAPNDNRATADNILYEFFNGVGPRDRHFGQHAFMTDVMKSADNLERWRSAALDNARSQGNCSTSFLQQNSLGKGLAVPSYPFDISRMLASKITGGAIGNMGFVGSYSGTITATRDNNKHLTDLHFHLFNATSAQSGHVNALRRTVTQTWDWNETWGDGPWDVSDSRLLPP
jgi:RHS repeat-associated protein